MCVCCTHLLSFFPLAVVLVNDLFSGFSSFLFWKCVRFCHFVFVAICCMHLYFMFTALSYQMLLSLMFFHILQCLTRCSFIEVLSYTAVSYQMFFH